MWICRRCAGHVKDDVLTCPRCGTPAPARLQPELAEHMSEELQELPHRKPINWLTHTTLPNLRKRAQSPWVWVLFGFVFGLGGGTIKFHGSLAPPILCAGALAVVFGLLATVIRWRRQRWFKDTYTVELGAILGFFFVVILAVIDAFTNHEGWESLHYLLSISFPVIVFGVFLAVFGAISTGVAIPSLKILARPLARRLRRKQSTHQMRRIATPGNTSSLGRHSTYRASESNDRITKEKDGGSLKPNADFHIQQETD